MPSTFEDAHTLTKPAPEAYDIPGHLQRLHAANRLSQNPIAQTLFPQGLPGMQPWQSGLARTLSNPSFVGSMAAGPLSGLTKFVGGIGGIPALAGLYGLVQHGTGLNDLRLLLGGGAARSAKQADIIDRHLASFPTHR
jgi:hypothetical protein